MLESDFWRDLAEKFRPLDPLQLLRADWHQVVEVGEQVPPVATWHLVGTDRNTRSILFDFDALARRGGPRVHPVMDSRDGWLEALKEYQLNAEIQGTGIESKPDGTIVAHVYSGSIMRVCQASVDLCKLLESLALETERLANIHEQQKDDPKNWPPVRQYWEVFKKIRDLTTGSHEEIPEALVRYALAQQYGISPQDVTWKQIQFAVRDLLSEYPAITMLPSQPVPPAAKDEPAKTVRPSSGKIASLLAAERMKDFIEQNGLTQPVFAERAGTTDRTIRSFGKNGKVRKDIFRQIAEAMGTTPEKLLSPDMPLDRKVTGK